MAWRSYVLLVLWHLQYIYINIPIIFFTWKKEEGKSYNKKHTSFFLKKLLRNDSELSYQKSLFQDSSLTVLHPFVWYEITNWYPTRTRFGYYSMKIHNACYLKKTKLVNIIRVQVKK